MLSYLSLSTLCLDSGFRDFPQSVKANFGTLR
jgi:hypothetical protein